VISERISKPFRHLREKKKMCWGNTPKPVTRTKRKMAKSGNWELRDLSRLVWYCKCIHGDQSGAVDIKNIIMGKCAVKSIEHGKDSIQWKVCVGLP
jgi:hypothetical protein